MKNKPWIALFSQTGSEIYNISRRLSRFPDIIITNNNINGINKELFEFYKKSDSKRMIVLDNKPTVADYEKVFGELKNPIITLHGWLRIIPEEICEKYTIYNGHPGLITKYPELKGFNPQERAIKYSEIGCVIHEVIPEVDEGKILAEKSVTNIGHTKNEIIEILHELSGDLWIQFLKEKI